MTRLSLAASDSLLPLAAFLCVDLSLIQRDSSGQGYRPARKRHFALHEPLTASKQHIPPIPRHHSPLAMDYIPILTFSTFSHFPRPQPIAGMAMWRFDRKPYLSICIYIYGIIRAVY